MPLEYRIDYSHDEIYLVKHPINNLNYERYGSAGSHTCLGLVYPPERLIVPLATFKRCQWLTPYVTSSSAIISVSLRFEWHNHPRSFDLLNFRSLRELKVVINEEDPIFRRITQTKLLYDQHPLIYEKILQLAATGEIARFHEQVKPYLESQNWQGEYAKEVLKEMKIRVEDELDESSAEAARVNAPHWKTAKAIKLSVLYPDTNAKVVIAHHGDMANSLTQLEQTLGDRWAKDFKLPTIEIRYPDGVGMRAMSLSHDEEVAIEMIVKERRIAEKEIADAKVAARKVVANKKRAATKRAKKEARSLRVERMKATKKANREKKALGGDDGLEVDGSQSNDC